MLWTANLLALSRYPVFRTYEMIKYPGITIVPYPSKLSIRRTIQKSFHSLPLPVPVMSGSPLMYAGVTTRNIRRAVNIMTLQNRAERNIYLDEEFTADVHNKGLHMSCRDANDQINIFAKLSTNISLQGI